MRPGADGPSPSGPLPAAVLWDMDGTLIDSEPFWFAEEKALVADYGGVWTDELATQIVGSALENAARFIRDNSPVTLEPDAIATRLTSRVSARLREEIPWRPGARELLTALVEAGVPCALVTMSWRDMVEPVLEQLPGMFTASISGDEVTNGKPHPEPYLLAAEKLGVQASDCIALEDSANGVASAYVSGARTIHVPLIGEVPDRPGLARVDTLAGLTPADLVRITDAARA